MAEIKKTHARLFIVTITRRDILQGIVLNLKRTRASQKTSISLGHLYSND